MWLYIHRPFEVWPWMGALHVERVYMLVAIVYWALCADKRWIPNRLNLAFVLFWIVTLASWLLSPNFIEGMPAVEDYFKIVVFYLLVMTTVREGRDLKRLVVMYVVAAGLYMAHSLREYNCGNVTFDMGTFRMSGVDNTYGQPNDFAATVVYSLTMVLPLWPECRKMWQRWALVGYGGLGITCVVLTSSRMGFAALCCLIAIVLPLSKHRMKLVVLVAVAAPLIWNVLPEDRQNRFLTLWDPSYGPTSAQASAEGRLMGWRDGVRLWRENPVLGVGPGAFAVGRGSNKNAHHLYGQVLGELGTLGAVSFTCVLLAFLGNRLALRRLCRLHPEFGSSFESRLIGATMLSVVLLLIMGFGGHLLFRYIWLWFGAFQAIALACLRQREEESLLPMTGPDGTAIEGPGQTVGAR